MKKIIFILLLISFTTVSSQNMLNQEINLFKINLNLEPFNQKPKNKFIAKKHINNKPIIFISGVTFTSIGVYQLTIHKEHQFNSKQVKGSIPLNPHNLLIGVGLFTISLSFVI